MCIQVHTVGALHAWSLLSFEWEITSFSKAERKNSIKHLIRNGKLFFLFLTQMFELNSRSQLLRSRIQGIWKLMWTVFFFLFHYSLLQLRPPILSPNFHRFVILSIWWKYTIELGIHKVRRIPKACPLPLRNGSASNHQTGFAVFLHCLPIMSIKHKLKTNNIVY